MKRSISVLIIVLLILVTAPWQQIALADPSGPATTIQPPAPVAAPAAPNITATSATLIDAKTGTVLFSKNADEKRHIASTTKMMTALVAIRHGNLDDIVTTHGDVVGPGRLGGISLVPGERVSLRDLLYALLLPSANDAAVAIADHVGGSVDGFADLMNREAVSIGALDSHFMNPHGLDNPTHYSTAHDLALIARQVLQDPTLAAIVSTKTFNINRLDLGRATALKSHNALLSGYAGANGVKTGYTRGAGNCLVSSATRGGVSLIAVVLNAGSSAGEYAQSSALLNYGFGLYSNQPLITKGTSYTKVTLKDGRTIDLVAKDDVSAIIVDSLPTDAQISSVVDVGLPVKKDTVLGQIVVNQAGQAVATSDLVAAQDIDPLPAKPQPIKHMPAKAKLIKATKPSPARLTALKPPSIPQVANYLIVAFFKSVV